MQDARRRFLVHASHEGRQRGRAVEGGSFEEAAVAFVETWGPAVDAEGEVSVVVVDLEDGRCCCFRIDAEIGEAAASACA